MSQFAKMKFGSTLQSVREADVLLDYLSRLTALSRLLEVEKVVQVAIGGDSYPIAIGSAYKPKKRPGIQIIDVTMEKAKACCYGFLRDEDPKVRLTVANSLDQFNSPDGTSFSAMLMRDKDPEIRILATDYLNERSPNLLRLLNRGNEKYFISYCADRDRSFPDIALGGTTGISPAPAPELTEASLPEETVRRFTQCDVTPKKDEPGAAELSLGLNVKRGGASDQSVDVRIPEGREVGALLVHASSQTFEVSPATQVIKVPRRLDSQIAYFKLKADSAGEGDVLLTIFDEFRLIGSLNVRVRADGAPANLVLKKIDEKMFRDPSGEDRRPLWGNTIQVSFSGRGRERVKFEVLLPDETDGVLTPKLHPLGESSADFNASYIQNALNQFRDRVNRIEAMLGGGSAPGAPSLDVVRDGMRMELEGAGRHIASELLSNDVRAYLDAGAHKVVHWILKNPELDAVPWELACNPYSGEFLSKNSVLVRVPVHEGTAKNSAVAKGDAGGQPLSHPAGTTPAAVKESMAYVLGENVVVGQPMTPELHGQLMRVVQGALIRYDVNSNFDLTGRRPIFLPQLKQILAGAKVFHLLCHGVVQGEGNAYLSIENQTLGELHPYHVSTLHLSPGALVFLNACSSSTASFSPGGLTTFGWEFCKAGAAVCLATLAPVTTETALRFAAAFFDAHLKEGLEVAEAVLAARQQCAADPDPTWLFYSVYGELSDSKTQPQ